MAKTVVITGASAGLGKESAYQLAAKGWRVVMACRDPDKADCARLEIEKRLLPIRTDSSSSPEVGEVVLWPVSLDLTSAASVRKFAASVVAEEVRIDVLMHNAGVMPDPLTTVDFCPSSGKGPVELSFAVNHLGPFLLTTLLEPCIPAPGGRVVCVSSSLYKRGMENLDFDDLAWRTRATQYSGKLAYSVSKFAGLLWTFALHRRLSTRGIDVVALHPGMVATELGRHFTWWKRALMVSIAYLFLSSIEVGASTQVHCASVEPIESGSYYGRLKEEGEARFAPEDVLPPVLDEESQERLWAASEAQAGLSACRCEGVLQHVPARMHWQQLRTRRYE